MSANFGVYGLGVMGENLALNLADHGSKVAVYNRHPDVTRALVARAPQLLGAETLPAFVASLDRPRRILLMVKAGSPVDDTLAALTPLLEAGDIVIDGGNSWFEDTRRREAALKGQGFRFFGMGVSGGEEGARRGPSLMPGGDPDAYAVMQEQLTGIAATTDSGPCVAWCGPDGAGHFVKMVHNGIEYADMQLIAEVYAMLRRNMGAPALAELFGRWNEGPLASYLIEITAAVFGKQDDETGRPLVDLVLDEAGQKGTGRWTAQVALELGVPIPAIAAAVDARLLSANRLARRANQARLPTVGQPLALDPQTLHDALLAAKICAYAQGMRLLQVASHTYGWGTNLGEMARIWKGGCIIRARLLDQIRQAYAADPGLDLLLHDPDLARPVLAGQAALRQVVAAAALAGEPTPALAGCLSWLDAIRAPSLPQNLTQAQRDAFGAHTFVRLDHPERGAVHVGWLTS